MISGLSDAVVVVEAGEKSGALITAQYAMKQGRELFAVPGNINSLPSAGSNALLAEVLPRLFMQNQYSGASALRRACAADAAGGACCADGA